MEIFGGFTAEVDGDNVILRRHTRRIRATTPMNINVEWFPEGVPNHNWIQELSLDSQGSTVLSAGDWYHHIADENSIISVNNLCLRWENELIHEFGKARNFHIIKFCDVQYDGDNGHRVSIRFGGEDLFGNPFEDNQTTLNFDEISPFRVIKEIEDVFPPLCQFQFENPPTEEFLIPLGVSRCERFLDQFRFSISYDGTAPSLTSKRVSEAIKVVSEITQEHNKVTLTLANGDRNVISIRSTLEVPDDIIDCVRALDKELRGFVFAEEVNFAQVRPTNFVFGKGVYDAHRLILERSMEKVRNNIRYYDVISRIETDRLVVSDIRGWEVAEAPDGARTQHILILKATVENKFTGDTENVQANIKFLDRLPKHKEQIDHFIPFFGDEEKRVDYYHSISRPGATKVEINLSQSLSTLFDLEVTEAIFSMCPFTLTLFDAKMHTPIGPLPPELIQSPTPNLTHVEQLNLIEKWGRDWDEQVHTFGFWDNKYLDLLLDEIESVESFNLESFDRFKIKIDQSFAEERITDAMWSMAVDLAKQKMTI